MRTSTRIGKLVHRRDRIAHVKIVNPARGGVYYYFDTGQLNVKGKPVYQRLPSIDDKAFWSTYAALCAARTKRETATTHLMLGDLIALYRKSPKFTALKQSSQDLYDIYLTKLETAFNTAAAGDIERQDMVLLIDSMADRPGAANSLLRITNALFGWGRSRGHVQNDPGANIDLFELGEHEPWPDDLLAAGLAEKNDLIRTAVHLLYYTGQRLGDVVAMRWTDYRDGRIDIIQEKTGKPISVPPHPALKVLLETLPKKAMTILSNEGRAYKRQRLREIVQAWAKKKGVDIVPHGLRKNAVNALLEAGCSAAETAAITGQSLQVVEHYAKARNTRKLADSAILKWSKNG